MKLSLYKIQILSLSLSVAPLLSLPLSLSLTMMLKFVPVFCSGLKQEEGAGVLFVRKVGSMEGCAPEAYSGGGGVEVLGEFSHFPPLPVGEKRVKD